jgi:HAE1 family hydrophobic/amphiphilic exporter-1
MVTSKSGQGNTSFTLQFSLDKSLDGAATDVQAAITQAQGSLPPDLPAPPTMAKTNPNDQAIMYLALTTSTVTQGQLYDYANTQVGQEISIISGVARVQIYGTKGAVRIKADPSKLAARGMTMGDLAQAIQGGTAYMGSGQFDNANDTLLLKPKGQLDTAEGYNNLIVARSKTGGAPVYLRDVARAIDGVQDERINMRFWSREYGTPASTVVVASARRAATRWRSPRPSVTSCPRSRPSCRPPCSSPRSTTGRCPSSTRSTTCRRRCSSRSSWSCWSSSSSSAAPATP